GGDPRGHLAGGSKVPRATSAWLLSAATGSDGSFETPLLECGPWRVASGWAVAEKAVHHVVVEAGRKALVDFRIGFDAGGRTGLSGRVVDAAGEPVVDAWVEPIPACGRRCRTDDAGRF